MSRSRRKANDEEPGMEVRVYCMHGVLENITIVVNRFMDPVGGPYRKEPFQGADLSDTS